MKMPSTKKILNIPNNLKNIDVQKLRKSDNFNKIAGSVAALAIIVIGSIFLLVTHAATSTSSVEPEQGTKSGNATIGNDTSASGGKYLAFNAPSPPPPPSGALCGWRTTPPSTYKHVVWILMENHTYSQVIGQTTAPYMTDLATKSCASSTKWDDNYSSLPSLPHYIALTTGSNQGITDDQSPSVHPLTVDNLFRQVRTAGQTEKEYAEDMPANCTTSGSSPYAVRHNPATYFVDTADRSACQKNNVPMGAFPTSGNLYNDIKNNTLPNFAMILPNVCHMTHGPCNTTDQLKQGDDFMKSIVVSLTNSADYQAGNMAIFVIYDENTYIPNAVIAPTVKPGFVTSTGTSQFSALRTTEEMLGIKSYLGEASKAPSMRSLFNL